MQCLARIPAHDEQVDYWEYFTDVGSPRKYDINNLTRPQQVIVSHYRN